MRWCATDGLGVRVTDLARWGFIVGLLLFVSPAVAAEVVWLNEAPAEDISRVAALAGARRGPLTPAEFRSLLTDATPLDREAIEEVARVRAEVQVHETVLDGELLIMEGLERALARVRSIRDPAERDVVIGALLYQGFAVDRFWGDTLGTAADAAPYRITIDDQVVERPWVDAFGLEPLRKVSHEDIGEAPSREAYESLRRVLARTLRARVLAPDLPPGSVLMVDGEPVEVDETTVIELLPGQHFLHVELDGRIIGREAIRLQPGQRFELTLPLPESDWQAVLKAARLNEGLTPRTFLPFFDALGGEIWIAQGQGSDLRLTRIGPDEIASVAAPVVGTPARPGPGRFGDVSLEAWAGLGLMFSRDFEQPSPAGEGGRALAVPPSVGLGLAWDRSFIRYGLGVEVFLPVGPAQIARSGPSTYRFRFLPHLLLGHPLLQVTYGYLTPHHWMGGIQGMMPIAGDAILDDLLVEVRGGLRVGAGPTMERVDGSVWNGRSVFIANISIGFRLRPR
ncbi:MAG: hypothetical protein EA397_18990 [Deltaproteobacteria bacterium]|nr:MAG: hypothetical protein EA397_18990 [Deltaproteobacteria bacterium]